MKRKTKIKPISLPEFRTAQPVVKCFMCHNDHLKSEMNKAIRLTPAYICDGCKSKYLGKLEFKKCLDKVK